MAGGYSQLLIKIVKTLVVVEKHKSSFKRFVQILMPMMFVFYGIFFVIDPERYVPYLPTLVGSLLGAFMMAFDAWLYMRDKDDA